LSNHNFLAELIGADVINIHGGGIYGDKHEALKRLKKNLSLLSPSLSSKLTLENDDRCYTPQDLLPLCQEMRVPFVYDVHHHRCLPSELNPSPKKEARDEMSTSSSSCNACPCRVACYLSSSNLSILSLFPGI
jgi:UV DNA damage repair endonuclease